MMMMMMMIVDLYSALHRAPLLRYVFWCIVKRNVFSADRKDLFARYLTNCSRECRQNYNLDSLGHKDELFRFLRSKVKVASRPNMIRFALWEM